MNNHLYKLIFLSLFFWTTPSPAPEDPIQPPLEESTYKTLRSGMAQAQMTAESEMRGPDGANFAYAEFIRGYESLESGSQIKREGAYQRLGTSWLRGIENEFATIQNLKRRTQEERHGETRIWIPDMEETSVARLREILESWQYTLEKEITPKADFHRKLYVDSGGGRGNLLGYYQDQQSVQSQAVSAMKRIISYMEGAHVGVPQLHRIVSEATALEPSKRIDYIQGLRLCVGASGHR